MISSQDVILSVCMRSFNQRCFIEEALDSVLAQKTSFPFEIIVSDDYSSDGTVGVLKRYRDRFPETVRLILGESNVGGPANLRRVLEASSAKYVTCLDGDDYYLDEYKLQKQVDFLESHPDYSGCFHNTLNVKVDGTPLSLFNPLDFPAIHDVRSFIQREWFIPIHSAVFRRSLVSFPDWYESVMNDDYVVHLSVVKNGPYYYRPDVMVAYRHHGDNISSVYKDELLSASKLRDVLEGFTNIYPEEYLPVLRERIELYDKKIASLESERRHPWKKYFKARIYKRFIKRLIK